MIYHTVHERIPVSIKELDVTCDEWTKHLNTETGEIVDIPDDPIAADWTKRIFLISAMENLCSYPLNGICMSIR